MFTPRIVICVEASNSKGMGYLFRCLHLAKNFQSKKIFCMVLINNHKPSIKILKKAHIKFQTTELFDYDGNWETRIIKKHRINVWISARLNTDIRHTTHIKKNNALLVTFDNCGSGADQGDLHFATFGSNTGHNGNNRRTYQGVEYLILNPEINRYKRLRTSHRNILVSMGGIDTYGVNIKVVQLLKYINQCATIHTGLNFYHDKQLQSVIDDRFSIIHNVSSLIREFHHYDLAITSGGIIPFEANASGLPCLIIANEFLEIPNALFLHETGSSLYAGHYDDLNPSGFMKLLSKAFACVETMSRQGLERFHVKGIEHTTEKIINTAKAHYGFSNE